MAQSTDQGFSDEFYYRSVKVTEEVVCSVQKQFLNVHPYWAVAESEAVSCGLWSGFKQIWQEDGGLGDRLFHVYRALKKRHRFVVLIGADSPLIHMDHFTETFESLNSGSSFVLGSAYDGGFYLFGGSVDVPKWAWKKVRYSTNTTYVQLKNQLQGFGSIRELEPLLDIDEKKDIHSLLEAVPSNKTLLQSQIDIINWMSDYCHFQ